MQITTLKHLDVFAFIDSDTDEAKTYATYLGYWDCLARAITDAFGHLPNSALASDILARRKVRALSSTQFSGDRDLLRSFLLNGWNTELSLYLVDLDDPRLQPANQWTSVYAYYAAGRLALAWLLVRDGVAPNRHRPMLRALSAQVERSRLYPFPWSMNCPTIHPASWGGTPRAPSACSNLTIGLDPIDGIGKMLSTTRRKRVEGLVIDEKQKLGLVRARSGSKKRLDIALESTTVFDFAWRSRTRSNYGDPSMFYVGALGDQDRASQFIGSIRTWTNATMLLFEAFIAQKARADIVDAAVHYMSRDRTKISDGILGERLRALHLLK